MKNFFEKFAIGLALLLALGVVYLIVEYNAIDESNVVTVVDESVYETPAADK